MRLASISLTDFRNHQEITLEPSSGLTAIIGPNGAGKTNLIEAIGYLASLSSFRGVTSEAMVRQGASTTVIRSIIDQDFQVGTELVHRLVEIEAEIRVGARDRVLVNRQVLKRARDLLGSFRVTIFSPDDLKLVKLGPSERRAYMDEVLVALTSRNDVLVSDLERVLRQRNVLLKQAGGRLTSDISATLDVWDAKFAELGENLAHGRRTLVDRLGELVADTYQQISDSSSMVRLTYESQWAEHGLAKALSMARDDDLRRGITTTGPHRDELSITLDGMPLRTHGSQGEQRSLALALRLGSHHLVREVTGTSPVLLLDDVFSELDERRSSSLLANLPPGQALLTTTDVLPSSVTPDKVVVVQPGLATSVSELS